MELLNNKPLLELLSPFADKTLSEGCTIIFSTKNNGIYDGLIKKITEDFSIQLTKNRKKIFQFDCCPANRFYFKQNIDFKILGHIGITTVLKYIEDKGYNYTGIGNQLEIKILDENFSKIDFISSKELNLYSKQELEELYELLIELAKQ